MAAAAQQLFMQANPVRQFQLLYCAWHAAVLAIRLRSDHRFYSWFTSSGLSLATKRGLGAHPCRLYGFISPPRLTPTQLLLVGFGFVLALLLSLAPWAPRVCVFVAFLLSLCYFPSLFAENTVSGHPSILTPSVLFILSCASALDHQVQSGAEWPLALLRIFLASSYFSSGMCKLLCGIKFGRFWGNGPTLQFYIIDSLWSRPAGRRLRALQHWLVGSPRLLTVMATGSLAFEVGFALAPTSDTLGVAFAIAGFCFHIGIHLLLGLDFVSLWAAALLAFLVGVPAATPWTAALNGWESEPAFFLPAALYTGLQVLAALTLRDASWNDDVLPFSCCPMFLLPRNPYDEWPKFWTMSTTLHGGPMRQRGTLEPLYWSPMSSTFEMPLEEIGRLPQRVMWFGSSLVVPPEARKFVKPEFLGRPFYCIANFEVPAELDELLRAFLDEVNGGGPRCAWDPDRIGSLLALQMRCRDAFDACTAPIRHERDPLNGDHHPKRC